MTPGGSAGVEELARRFELSPQAGAQLGQLAQFLASDPLAPTAVREPQRILDDHLADSLVALELESLRSAGNVVDAGSGAGLPGLPLAIALPKVRFVLVESSGRKCEFIARAAATCGLQNIEVADSRIEDWARSNTEFDVMLARALAPLEVVIEYAAPALRVGGELVAWRGRRDPEAEERAARAADLLGLRPEAVRRVSPYAAAEARYLHLFLKVMDTPSRFPRRAGMAAKRPLGAG